MGLRAVGVLLVEIVISEALFLNVDDQVVVLVAGRSLLHPQDAHLPIPFQRELLRSLSSSVCGYLDLTLVGCITSFSFQRPLGSSLAFVGGVDGRVVGDAAGAIEIGLQEVFVLDLVLGVIYHL